MRLFLGIATALSALSLTAATAQQLVPQQQVMNEFAACIWRHAPERARAALATPVGTPAERAALRAVARLDQCTAQPFISGRTGEFRGALAEGGIAVDPARRQRIASMTATAPVRVSVASGRAFVASYASCLATADPAGALALLGTPVGSSAESAAIRAMGPAMSGCMAEGLAYRVDVRDVRNHVADALYRLSEEPNA